MEINYFSNCSNDELKNLWNSRKIFSSLAKDNPFQPYLEKYCSTASKMPIILCELDFYKECAKRFIENT